MWARFRMLLLVLPLLLRAQSESAVPQIAAALRAGQYRQAEQLSEAALKSNPADARLWTLQGMAKERLGDNKNALESFSRALELAADYVPALKASAQLEYKEGDQRAVRVLKKLVQLQPEDQTAHAMLAALAYRRGDCNGTLSEYDRSHPLIDSQKQALQQVGNCLVKSDRAPEAIAVYRRLTQFDAANPEFRNNLALAESIAGKPREVIQTLEQGSAEALDANALQLLSEAYEQVGDTPKSVQLLRQAIIQNPDQVRYYVDFANLALVHASYQVGIDMVNVGLKRVPASAALYVARGILHVQMGEYDKGDSDFKKAELLDPRVEEAASARGMAALQQNRLPEAEANIRERLAKAPRDSFLLYLLAEVLTRRGAAPGTPEFAEAVRAAQDSVRLKPDFALGRDVLGRLYLEEGRTAEAITESEAAVKDDPNDQTALYHLILALRKATRTDEVPALLKRLAALREAAKNKENQERRFALLEENGRGSPAPARP